MCHTCSEQLKNAFDLKIKCQKQDELFRQNIEETKSEIPFDLPTLVPITSFSDSTFENELGIKTEVAEITEVFCENLPELNELKDDYNSDDDVFDDIKNDDDDDDDGDEDDYNYDEEVNKPSTSSTNSRNTKFCYICQEFFDTNKELIDHKESHLECPFCDEKFEKYCYLISHRRKMHLTYPCRTCGKVLNTSTGLERHVRRLHLIANNGIEEDLNATAEMKETFCYVCQMLFPSFNEMTAHRKSHSDCPVCDESFRSYKDMTKHKFKEHKLVNPCKFCDSVLKTVRGLETHVRSVHLNEKKHFCELCPRTFFARHTLTRHQKTVHGINATRAIPKVLEETRPVEIPEVVYNDPNEEGKNHFCNICQNFYPSLKELLIHKKIHKECPVCNLNFVTHSLMIKHRRDEHKNDNICKYCSKSLLTTLVLERHVRIIHFKEKLEKCLICKERFSSYPQLRNHKKLFHKIEGVDKPDKVPVKKEPRYVCQFCGKNFIKPFLFREHLRIHTNEKPFECRQCKQTFRLKCTYQRHVLSHLDRKQRPFKCTFCTKSFLTKLFLTAHMAKHTGEKNFKCDICNIDFGYYNSLYDHKKNIHEGVRKSQCDLCSQWFYNNSLLNKHKKHCKK